MVERTSVSPTRFSSPLGSQRYLSNGLMQKATPSLSSGQASASQEEIAMFANVARNTVGTISKSCSARGYAKPA